MRIVSGFLKARRFSVPKRFPSRPTTDFAKEGLFNVLENHFELEASTILDLCAGTGNITFEFISRNAKFVTCVDNQIICLNHIRKIASDFQISGFIKTEKSDVLSYLRRSNSRFNLIFADPPYDFANHQEIVSLVFERNLLLDDGLLIVEHGKNTKLESDKHFVFSREYGNVHFSFFRLNSVVL